MTSTQRVKNDQVAARLTPVDARRIDDLVANGLYRSHADFVREAIREKLRSFEPSGIMDVSENTAEKMILEYLRRHPGPNFASEIANELGIDYGIAFRTINRLLESHKIRKSKV